MNRPILFKGIDVAVPLTYDQCKSLKAANYRFVGRYYTDYLNPRYQWKMMYKDEAKLISNAGLDIVSIYETSGFYEKVFSMKSGKADCINALRCAEMIGQPFNTTIYFAYEELVELETDISNVFQYFLGISKVMKKYKQLNNGKAWNIGAYGSCYFLNKIYNKYGILDCWQWLETPIFDKVHLRQSRYSFPACNINEIDEDWAYSNFFGQFKI